MLYVPVSDKKVDVDYSDRKVSHEVTLEAACPTSKKIQEQKELAASMVWEDDDAFFPVHGGHGGGSKSGSVGATGHTHAPTTVPGGNSKGRKRSNGSASGGGGGGGGSGSNARFTVAVEAAKFKASTVKETVEIPPFYVLSTIIFY